MIQILDMSSKCSDAALSATLKITKNIISFIGMIVPIILLTMAVINLVRLIMNPDEKNDLTNYKKKNNEYSNKDIYFKKKFCIFKFMIFLLFIIYFIITFDFKELIITYNPCLRAQSTIVLTLFIHSGSIVYCLSIK